MAIGRSIALGLFLLAAGARAGGGPFGTVVVVNDRSPHSLEVGRYYAERRGIPEDRIFHLRTTNGFSLDTAAFSNEIRNPLIAWLGASGLSNQLDTLVFAPDIPYRIHRGPLSDQRYSGLTSCMFYDFKSSPNPFVFGCQLAPDGGQDYFEAERVFAHADAPSGGRYWISALLTASNRDEARRLVDRSVAADATAPTSTVLLLHTDDPLRNLRWPQFEDVHFRLRLLGGPCTAEVVDANAVVNRTNIIGYLTGLGTVGQLEQNHFLPGAFGHHLTSYAGYLFDAPGQMSALDWLHHGGVGSYGPVVEPCNFLAKYPHSRWAFWYARGFSLGEAIYQSIQAPYPGVVVGDPLCAPFAVTGRVEVAGLTNHQSVAGLIVVTVTVTAADAEHPINAVDWYLDGRFVGVLTNASPQPGNEAVAVVGLATGRYTVAAGDTVYVVASGLVAALQGAGAPVAVSARADRVELTWTNLGTRADGLPYAASAGAGTAAVRRLVARAWTPDLRDPDYPARELISLRGLANSGDAVRCQFTLTNGVVVTSRVEAVGGETAAGVMTQLMAVINGDPMLQAADGVRARYFAPYSVSNVEASLEARAVGPEGRRLLLDYAVTRAMGGSGLVEGDSFSDAFNDNAEVLQARGVVQVGVGATSLTAVLAFDTAVGPDGPRELAVVAREGTAVSTETRRRIPFRVANHGSPCAVTAPASGIHRAQGSVVTARVEAAGATQVLLRAEGKPWAQAPGGLLDTAVTTTVFGAGPLFLQGEAWFAGGLATRSGLVTVQLFTDDDADGLADQWEYRYFGGLVPSATADPDADGVDNAAEYGADTLPTNAVSFLAVSGRVVAGLAEVTFAARTTRTYQVEVHGGDLREAGGWQTASTQLWAGVDGVVMFSEAAGTGRAYRVRAALP